MGRFPTVWNPWRGLGHLPPMVWVVAVATFINRVGTMVLPFLAIYITDAWGLPPSRAGFALAVFGVGGLLSAPLGGWLSDRIGAIRVMTVAFLSAGALLLVVPLATSYTVLVALIGVWALLNEAVRPATLVALTDGLVPAQRKPAIALNRLAVNLGMGIGPAVGGMLVTIAFPLLFWVDGLSAILAGVFMALAATRLGWQHRAREGAVASPREMIDAFFDPRMIVLLLGILLVVLVFDQHRSTLPLYVTGSLGFSETFYGFLFIINTGIILLVEVPLNLKTAHWPSGRTLALGALFVAVGFGATGLASSEAGVIGSVVLWTCGEMLLFPGLAAYVADVAPEDRRGAYMGAFSLAGWMAIIPAPLVGTWLLERFGGGALWTAALGVGLMAALVLGRLRDTHAVRPAEV